MGSTESGHQHEDIGCLEAIEALYAWLDDELGEDDVQQLEEHLAHCRSCYSRSQVETALADRLRESSKSRAPERLKTRLKGLLDQF